VYFFSAKVLVVCLPATVIFFLIAGLLFFAPRARYHWELIASRLETGILISSVFVNHLMGATHSFSRTSTMNQLSPEQIASGRETLPIKPFRSVP
jgi:hypothetical protein